MKTYKQIGLTVCSSLSENESKIRIKFLIIEKHLKTNITHAS